MFVAAAAVLVLEILALRLIAPYVGVTLQTNTAVIGAALLAIALGAWFGGQVADRKPPDPGRLIGPLLLVGAALIMLTLPLVRFAGESTRGSGDAGATVAARDGHRRGSPRRCCRRSRRWSRSCS